MGVILWRTWSYIAEICTFFSNTTAEGSIT